MGFFTWTDARREPRTNKRGDFITADKIGYDCFAKIVCPDNTEISEPYYEGYGIFDGKDVYDLVVDWNKTHLSEIFDKMLADDPKCWGYHLRNLAVCYQNDDMQGIDNELQSIINSGEEGPHFKNEWKRAIGIAIACSEKNNQRLPFPIKITRMKRKRAYADLYPSYNCQ